MSLTVNAIPLAAMVKNATQKIHTDVEEILLPRLSSIQTKNDYASILKMIYGYFQPIKKSIALYLTSQYLTDIAERRNAVLLLSDLQRVGYSTDRLETSKALPEITTAAQAFGAFYVLEGSTLGGEYIAKLLAKNPVIPEGTTRFFSGYDDQTGSKWKTFLDVLNRQADHEAIVASAVQTFTCLKTWMKQSL